MKRGLASATVKNAITATKKNLLTLDSVAYYSNLKLLLICSRYCRVKAAFALDYYRLQRCSQCEGFNYREEVFLHHL